MLIIFHKLIERFGRLVFLAAADLSIIIPASIAVAASLKMLSYSESLFNKSGALSLSLALNMIIIEWSWTDIMNTFAVSLSLLLIAYCARLSQHLRKLSKEKLASGKLHS